MGGTLLNIVTVLIGSALGLLIGNRISEKMQSSVMTGLGFVSLVVGIGNAQNTGNIIIPLLALVFGVILGELIGIDAALERFAGWLQAKTAGMGGGMAMLTSGGGASSRASSPPACSSAWDR